VNNKGDGMMDVEIADRLARIETMLVNIQEEQKKSYDRTGAVDLRVYHLEQRLVQNEKQIAFWQGALALIAVAWPAILKWMF
jgi:hypothetical protein